MWGAALGTVWDRVGPCGTVWLWDRVGPCGTAWDRVGPCGYGGTAWVWWDRMGWGPVETPDTFI